MVKTPEQIRADWKTNKLTVSEWARRNGYSPRLVIRLLNGETRGLWGVSRQIAQKLGLVDSNYEGDSDD